MSTSDVAATRDGVDAEAAETDLEDPTGETEPIKPADLGSIHDAPDGATDSQATIAEESPLTSSLRHQRFRRRAAVVTAFGVLPASVLACAVAAAYFKWDAGRSRDTVHASEQAVEAARDNTLAMLSYQPDTAADTLTAAAARLTGPFRDQYTKLITDVVIPGATQRKIAALVNIPGAAAVSASPDHAVVLVFVNQDVTVGNEPPRDTSSTVKVTLDKVAGRWLTSSFDPM